MVDRSQRHARMAAEAADRVGEARRAGAQLGLFTGAEPVAEPAAAAPGPVAPAGAGRPVGARSKNASKLRDMLAARGVRMPEDQLVALAGLQDRGMGPIEAAMARAEQLLMWAEEGKDREEDRMYRTGRRLKLALDLLKEMRLAAEALMPYGLQKLAPDTVVQAQQTTIIQMPGGQGGADPAQAARVVGASGPSDAGRFAPPPLPGEVQRNQGVADAEPVQSDAASRTEGASR